MGRFPKLRTLGFRVYSLAIRPFGGTDLEGLYRVFYGIFRGYIRFIWGLPKLRSICAHYTGYYRGYRGIVLGVIKGPLLAQS